MIPGLQIEESDPILKLLLFSHEDLYDAYFTALQAWLKTHETEGFFVGGHEPSGGGGSMDYLELCSGCIIQCLNI